jgi:Zn-dependent protease with chaperone function
LAVLVFLAWRVLRRAVGVIGEARAVFSMERRPPSRHGPARLVLIDDPVPDAYAVAALPRCGGHIVVSTGILDTLSDPELRHAVYEHERAHLRDHHAALRLLADLTVAVNPLLARAHRQTAFLLERCADEDAAKATSRATAAEALATVSLATIATQGRLAFHAIGVPARVDALLADAPTSRLRTTLVALALAGRFVVATAAIVHACQATETLFENGQRWYQLGR